MSREELQSRLEGLALGESEVLTRRHFDEIFAVGIASLERQKLEAAEFGESRGCRVMFTGEEAIYAVFTRRQTRHDLRLGRT